MQVNVAKDGKKILKTITSGSDMLDAEDSVERKIYLSFFFLLIGFSHNLDTYLIVSPQLLCIAHSSCAPSPAHTSLAEHLHHQAAELSASD